MKNKGKKTTDRRPYAPPQLRVIELVADEVLAAGCKLNTGGSGPLASNATCTTPSQCYVPGS